jgi:hypothetical protein
MALLSLGQARVVDPLLTSMAYGAPIQGLIGHKIMPFVPIKKRKTKVVVFGQNRERQLYVTRRTPGSDIVRIESAYGDTDIELYQDALEYKLPYELDEESEDIVDMQMDAVTMVKTGLCNRLEFDIFAQVNNFAGYPATNRSALLAATQFSNTAVNPIAAFDIANQAVLTGIGRLPNTIVYGGLKAFNAIKENPRVRDQIKYTDPKSISMQALGGILGYPTSLLSLASYVNPAAPNTQIPFFDNSIWVGYVPGNGESINPHDVASTLIPETGANKRIPSWGYTYVRMAASIGNGHETGLLMEPPYQEKNKRSWIFPGVVDRLPIVTGMAAGYLFTNVSA